MASSVRCEHLQKDQIVVRTPRFAWMVDEPKELGGDGLAPDPIEMLLCSLCTCKIVTVCRGAAREKIPLDKVWADADSEWKLTDARRELHVKLTVRVAGPLDEAHMKRIEEIVANCSVHKVLAPGAIIRTELKKT